MQQNSRVYIQTWKTVIVICNTSQYKKTFLISRPSCLQNAWGGKRHYLSRWKICTSSYNPEDARKSNPCEKSRPRVSLPQLFKQTYTQAAAVPHSLVKHLLYQTCRALAQTPGNNIRKSISGSSASWKLALWGRGDSFLNGSAWRTGSARTPQSRYDGRARAGRARPRQLRPNLP